MGLVIHKKVGDFVDFGESLCTIHYNDETQLDEVKRQVYNAYKFSADPQSKSKIILAEVDEKGSRFY